MAVILLAVAAIPAGATGSSTRVFTDGSGNLIKVKDDFSSLVDRNPDPNVSPPSDLGPPYFIADSVYSAGPAYGYNTNNVAFIETGQRNNGDTYARFKIKNDPGFNPAAPNYILADLQEGPSGQNYHGGPNAAYLKWNPTPDNPVRLSWDMRLPGCNTDGTGCGTGTQGLVLWNGPIGVDGGIAFDYKHMGCMFVSADSDRGIAGLTCGTIWNQVPRDTFPVNVDPSEWHNYVMLWTENVDGSQTVEFKVDGTSFGTASFTAAEASQISNLGTEAWLDNYSHITFNPDGSYFVTYANPAIGEPRIMDIADFKLKYKTTED